MILADMRREDERMQQQKYEAEQIMRSLELQSEGLQEELRQAREQSYLVEQSAVMGVMREQELLDETNQAADVIAVRDCGRCYLLCRCDVMTRGCGWCGLICRCDAVTIDDLYSYAFTYIYTCMCVLIPSRPFLCLSVNVEPREAATSHSASHGAGAGDAAGSAGRCAAAARRRE